MHPIKEAIAKRVERGELKGEVTMPVKGLPTTFRKVRFLEVIEETSVSRSFRFACMQDLIGNCKDLDIRYENAHLESSAWNLSRM